MPYGMKGGDTPENTKFMEDCVQKVMKSGKDKTSAIMICKVTYEKMQGHKAKADLAIDLLLDKETNM